MKTSQRKICVWNNRRTRNTNTEIETTTDDLNEFYYKYDAIESNIESEEKYNCENEKRYKRHNIKNAVAAVEQIQPGFSVK